ncbi:hypothetical protein ACJX0J_020635, partial [Zea mays]
IDGLFPFKCGLASKAGLRHLSRNNSGSSAIGAAPRPQRRRTRPLATAAAGVTPGLGVGRRGPWATAAGATNILALHRLKKGNYFSQFSLSGRCKLDQLFSIQHKFQYLHILFELQIMKDFFQQLFFSNRVACSEVREFEYRDSEAHYMETSRSQANGVNEMHLHIRLEKLLTLGPDGHQMLAINSLMLDGKWSNQESSVKEVVSTARVQSLKKLVKEKLHQWLICKVNDDGKGPNVLCKEGQGVIHLVAALGYDWAIRPIIIAGVNVNFRDAHGWTTLHWAASLGRERTVSVLIANGAAAGALTDPTSEFPSERSPADLAPVNGHKGISGFLAESALTCHLSALTIRESNDSTVECGLPFAEDLTGIDSVHLAGEGPDAESLEGSLNVVRKSTQAAARIFQAFRVDSLYRKKVVEYGDVTCGLSDECTLSLVSLKNVKPEQHDTHLHSAAVRIQNKFRGWKGRKEFMIIRQRIVKPQRPRIPPILNRPHATQSASPSAAAGRTLSRARSMSHARRTRSAPPPLLTVMSPTRSSSPSP